MNTYYTTTQISKMLGVTTATVNEWINSGKLESFKTPGGHNRVREDLLLNFLKENSIPVPNEMDRHSRPRILVVEDDEDVRDFIIAVINVMEYMVDYDIAIDGYGAGNKVANYKPDIVILDIMLPGTNGIEICKQIRTDLGEDTKVLAITGYYSEDNRKKIMAAGANNFMKKPMLLDEFQKVLNKYIDSLKGRYQLQEKI